MVDASTNCTDLMEESEDVSTLKQNQYYTINIMILSRSPTTSGHTFTFTTNFRGQLYHGVLTDGSPPMIHNNQIQKRAAAAEKEKGNNEDSDEKTKREVTPKPRGPKRSRGDDETKSPAKLLHKHRHKSPPQVLHEISADKYIRCPHQMCGYRFLAMSDVNNHLLNSHVDGKAVIKEEIATQTEPFNEECQKCKKLEQELIERQSMDALFKNVKAPKKEKSPISDDDAAPTLQKEVTYPEGLNKVPPILQGPPSPTLEAVAREKLPTMPSFSSIAQQKIEQQQSQQQIPPPSMPTNIPPISAASIASAFSGFPGGIPAAGAIPPSLFFNTQFNPNFATNPLFQQAAAAAAVAATPPKPQQMPFPTPQGFPPNNGLSPIPSSSKVHPQQQQQQQHDPNRQHKIHELQSIKAEPSSISSATIPGRSITAGTSGNPMDLLNIRSMQRPIVPQQQQQQQQHPQRPSTAAATTPLMQGTQQQINFLQQQMMLSHMFPGGDLSQFNFLTSQAPGSLFHPK
jgi:DNA-directed RNA polymerase subunit RPC12/RpoP